MHYTSEKCGNSSHCLMILASYGSATVVRHTQIVRVLHDCDNVWKGPDIYSESCYSACVFRIQLYIAEQQIWNRGCVFMLSGGVDISYSYVIFLDNSIVMFRGRRSPRDENGCWVEWICFNGYRRSRWSCNEVLSVPNISLTMNKQTCLVCENCFASWISQSNLIDSEHTTVVYCVWLEN